MYKYNGILTLQDGTTLDSPEFKLTEVTWHVETNKVSAMVHFFGAGYDVARIFEQDLGATQLIDNTTLEGLIIGFDAAIQNA